MYDIITRQPLNPRVTTVTPLKNYKLDLIFTNGERRVFDAEPLLQLNAFKPLSDESFFNSVKVAYGSITWPHDIDYCPDTLYIESTPAERDGVKGETDNE